MLSRKKLIVIAGPTAAGKSSLAIKVAKKYNTEIISADSRQCYRELSIGVARPSGDELSAVRHHFIAAHSIHEKINAGFFEQYALKKCEEIFRSREVLVVVGGTGLYIDALCNGIDEMPPVPEEVREKVIADYKQFGLAWLQNSIKEKDPVFFAHGEIHNPQRLMRALEMYNATGTSILEFKKNSKAVRPFDVIKIVLNPDKELLHKHIETRVEQMIVDGLVDEVKSLYPFRNLIALNTVGYKEIFSFIGGTITLDKAKELIKTHTRQYAKRQITWFKKDLSYNWHSSQVEVLNFLKNQWG